MVLKTQRLILKEISITHLEHIHTLHSIPQVDEFNTLGIPKDSSSTESLVNEWINLQKVVPRMLYTFCIEQVEPNEFVGLIALNLGKLNFRNAEVWYKLHPDFWKQGYATEALKKLLEFGFQNLNLHRIEAGSAVDNIASIKVLEKVGMIREGRKREVLPIRGKWVDNYFYGILKSDLYQRESS
ncbi:MAG: GNAT family N-acetyltransferase [Pyrinomonadaceae bacterium]|nr:GNAT family N-acetyltransferase [Sphingobacteriaceae bacterium]